MAGKTTISIEGDAFHINGQPTYPGRSYQGHKIEGLLLNSRMVQGIFDDLNPDTRARWDYPDGPWDAERNTNEFIEAMPLWQQAGLVSFTINLQGGSPEGYSKEQPWHNSAFTESGELQGGFMARLKRILDAADELGMIPMVGFFYFGQDQRLTDEAAVIRAVENATDWLLTTGHTNLLIEVGNEVDLSRFDHEIIRAPRGHQLIELVKTRSAGRVNAPGGRLLVSTSMSGNKVPPDNIAAVADFMLLHGNGVKEPDRIRELVDLTRALPSYHGQPVLFNEDDHFNFDQPDNNMLAALSRYAGWGYFDYRMAGEAFDDGYQSVPVNWGISSARKKGFFDLLAKVTGNEA
jgi:hypothetical protein